MSDDKVVEFPGVSRLDLDPDRVLRKAVGEMRQVVICGEDKNGRLYFASSLADGADILWWMERAKFALMEFGAGDDVDGFGDDE